mmetsp:Transcript_63726/g.177226  ORF Transcript_63726/g.177226 Transcript_63726/m.177226 type:complete len:236 (+) Transcript_63726:3830-4537(+)
MALWPNRLDDRYARLGGWRAKFAVSEKTDELFEPRQHEWRRRSHFLQLRNRIRLGSGRVLPARCERGVDFREHGLACCCVERLRTWLAVGTVRDDNRLSLRVRRLLIQGRPFRVALRLRLLLLDALEGLQVILVRLQFFQCVLELFLLGLIGLVGRRLTRVGYLYLLLPHEFLHVVQSDQLRSLGRKFGRRICRSLRRRLRRSLWCRARSLLRRRFEPGHNGSTREDGDTATTQG